MSRDVKLRERITCALAGLVPGAAVAGAGWLLALPLPRFAILAAGLLVGSFVVAVTAVVAGILVAGARNSAETTFAACTVVLAVTLGVCYGLARALALPERSSPAVLAGATALLFVGFLGEALAAWHAGSVAQQASREYTAWAFASAAGLGLPAVLLGLIA